MKNIKQIREEFAGLADENDGVLNVLVETGLLDARKVSVLKRALNENNRVLTPSEKKVVLGLVESLIADKLSEESEKKEAPKKTWSGDLSKSPTKMSVMPSILVLKRKAIRNYPGGQNVGLYYSQELDRYVAVPFSSNKGADKVSDGSVLSMNEERIDEISDELQNKTFAARDYKLHKSPVGSKERDKNLQKSVSDAQNIISKHVKKHGVKTINDVAKTSEWSKKRAKKLFSYAKDYGKKKDAEAKKPKKATPDEQRKASFDAQSPWGSLGRDFPEKKKKKNVKDWLASREKTRSADEAARKARAKAERDHEDNVEKDKSMRGTNIGADILNHSRDEPGIAIGHVIGKALYRMRNPTPLKEEVVDEGMMDVIKTAGGKTMSLIKRTLQGAANGKSEKAETKAEKPIFNGKNAVSKLRIKTSGVETDRARRAQRAVEKAQAAALKEQTEVDIGGNTFLLNTSVANKVQAVYQTLNEENRRKMVEKMSESEDSLNKIISFAVRY